MVERDLAKVDVAGPTPVSRSSKYPYGEINHCMAIFLRGQIAGVGL